MTSKTARSLEERFAAGLGEPLPNGCCEWTGRRHSTGYGLISNLRAHRVAWELTHGPIPPGLFVCHRCDNRPCVNIEHLFLGTSADNNADMHSKRRGVCPVGDRHGQAKLTERDVGDVLVAIKRGEPQRSIARRFMVARPTIGDIAQGITWRHIPRL